MGTHPLSLAARLILEISALTALGYWGWMTVDGALRLLLAITLPLIAAILWGTLTVPDDPSRSGRAPVPVPGMLRLLFELALFGAAAWALLDAGAETAGWILGAATLVHYALSYDRIRWLVTH